MDAIEVGTIQLTTPVGIALVVIGVIVLLKAVKTVVKVVMLVVIAAGLYLWFGSDGDLSRLNPF